MEVVPGKLICPVCGTDSKAQGDPFTTIWQVSLHIVGKAITGAEGQAEHEAWVRRIVPDANLQFRSINKVGLQIRYYVQEAVEDLWRAAELEEEDSEEDAVATRGAEIQVEHGERSPEECERYVDAYRLIWEIETRLHRFVSLCLGDKYGYRWVERLPRPVRDKCMERADQEKHVVPWECYIDFLDIAEIVKAEKEAFEDAFGRLEQRCNDPKSAFHSGLRDVAQIRNSVMHPLKRLTPTEKDMTTLEQFAQLARTFTSFG